MHLSQVGLTDGTFGMVDEGGLYDVIYNKIRNRHWFVIFIPATADDLRIPYRIEMQYYPPKTRKNAGFEILPVHDHFTTILFCHKSCMDHKQLKDILSKVADPVPDIPEKKDIIPLFCFEEIETHEWIRKVLAEYKRIQEAANQTHQPQSFALDIMTEDPKVIREMRIFEGFYKLYNDVLDYVLKQVTKE